MAHPHLLVHILSRNSCPPSEDHSRLPIDRNLRPSLRLNNNTTIHPKSRFSDIFPNKTRSRTRAGKTTPKVFSILLETMDRFRQHPLRKNRVFFLATCPDAAALDPSLLQRGRLETVLLLGTLDASSRASILDIHSRDMPLQLLLAPSTKTPTWMSPPGEDQTAETGLSGPRSLTTQTVTADAGTQDIGSYSAPCCAAKAAHSLSNSNAPSAAALSLSGIAAPAGVPAAPRTRKEFIGLVAGKCHGYLGSDLERLCREAAIHHMAAASADTTTTINATVSPSGVGRTLAGSEGHGEEAQDDARDRCSQFPTNADRSGGGGVGVGEGVRLQDFWAALDVVRPASLVGRSVGMWGDDSRGSEVQDSLRAQCCGSDASCFSHLPPRAALLNSGIGRISSQSKEVAPAKKHTLSGHSFPGRSFVIVFSLFFFLFVCLCLYTVFRDTASRRHGLVQHTACFNFRRTGMCVCVF